MRLALLLVCGFIARAPPFDTCSSRQDVAAPTPSAKVTSAPVVAVQEPLPGATRAALLAMFPRAAALGERCDPHVDAGVPLAWETQSCSGKGRVAVVYGAADLMHGVPEGAKLLTSAPATPGGSFVAVLEGHLLVRRVTCGTCRRILGWSMVGRPEEMPEVDLVAVQRALGLPAELLPLRTVDMWTAQDLRAIQ